MAPITYLLHIKDNSTLLLEVNTFPLSVNGEEELSAISLLDCAWNRELPSY